MTSFGLRPTPGRSTPTDELDAVACPPGVAFDRRADPVNRVGHRGQRRHRRSPRSDAGPELQREPELAYLSVKLADLAPKPLDVGAGREVHRMEEPRRQLADAAGRAGPGADERRAELDEAAAANERVQQGREPTLDRVDTRRGRSGGSSHRLLSVTRERGTLAVRERSHSPRALACASNRRVEVAPSSSSPRITKLRAPRFASS